MTASAPQPARAPDPDRADLETTLQTALEVGVRVQMSGGYSARVYETMNRVARAMGAERVEPSVTSVIVGLTVHRAGWSRTAIERTPQIGVNFAELSRLTRLSRAADSMTPTQIVAELSAIQQRARRYPASLVLPLLGVACASFAGLFGADLGGIVLAGLAGALGATVRHLLHHRGFAPFVLCLVSAFSSGALVLALAGMTDTRDLALSACALYLVPGVPLLNGTADLLTGHYLNGMVRLMMSTVIVVSSAVGLALALTIWRVI